MGAISGIDWASEWHDVRVCEQDGTLLLEKRFTHDEAGISELIAVLTAHLVECCAIERGEGLLVGRLLSAGIQVLAIHPNQVKATRDRYRAAAGKSDRFDAMVLCELARTDRHRFPALTSSSDQTTALKTLLRTREDLVEARVALANQLRAQLDAFWPGAVRIFADVDSLIGLAFLKRYPTPQDTRGLSERRLESFLARHSYSGRRPASELLERLHNAPRSVTAEIELQARRTTVLGLTAVLRPLVEQISQLTSKIACAIRCHPDGEIFLSFFRYRKSVITAAGLLAEIGDDRSRYPHAETLAADAGQTPVAIESGKRRTATFRWACDKRLRQHVGVLADTSRHHNPWAHDIYQRARNRGCDHPHAIRILGRAWTRILWRCWQDHTTYQPTKHRALNTLLTKDG
jgi:transposase